MRWRDEEEKVEIREIIGLIHIEMSIAHVLDTLYRIVTNYKRRRRRSGSRKSNFACHRWNALIMSMEPVRALAYRVKFYRRL